MENVDFSSMEKEGAQYAHKNGLDPVSYKEMCDMMKNVKKDPAMRK